MDRRERERKRNPVKRGNMSMSVEKRVIIHTEACHVSQCAQDGRGELGAVACGQGSEIVRSEDEVDGIRKECLKALTMA